MRAHLLSVAALLALAGTARAETPPAPPIKPGLWQVQTVRETDGKKAPEMSEHLKTMSPEARKRMEDAMKQHGIDMSGSPGQMKTCMTRESLDAGTWQGLAQVRCKTEFSTRSSTRWTWHSTCSQPASQTDGEVNFTSPEAYTLKSSNTLNMQGKMKVTTMTMTAKWLGADCAGLKPLTPGQLKPPAEPASKP